MSKQKYLFFYSLTVFCLIIISCRSNRRNPDISGVKVNKVNIIRFERELFNSDTAHWAAAMGNLYKKYPDIMEVFTEQVMRFGPPDKPKALTGLKNYTGNRYIREVYNDCQKIYPDMKTEENAITEAFRHIKYYYPKDTLPHVYTVLSNFSTPTVFTYENGLGISLDMYLGVNYRIYDSIPDYPDYLKKRFTREFILPDVVKTVFEKKYDYDKMTDQTMLSQAIFLGKQLYFLDMVTPNMPDTLKIGYSKDQMKWCVDNAGLIWNHVVTHEILYNTKGARNDKYLKDAPFTNDEDVPRESSPRLGEWVGWQIVRQYMDNNPDVTPQQLFEDKDYKKILALSKYKPKI